MRARAVSKLTLLFPLSLAVAGALALGSVAQAARVTTKQDFKVEARATISVDSEGGSVTVEPGPAGVVTVEMERRGTSENSARALPVTINVEGNTVKIRFHRDRPVHWGRSESVDFRIIAPTDSRIDAETGGGSVHVTGMNGGVEVQTGGGSVGVGECKGKIHVRTGGGGIDLAQVSGNVEATTGGGSVMLRGALSGHNVVETGGGSIHVAIPADSRLNVDASTGGGSAHNDFGIATDGNKWGPPRGFHGKIGDGSAGSLQLRTGGGSISLERS